MTRVESPFFWQLNREEENVIIYLNYVKMFESLRTIKANFTGNLVGRIKAIGSEGEIDERASGEK
jgi:hypothetical protein